MSIHITRYLLQNPLSYLAVASSMLSQRLMRAHPHQRWIGSFVKNCGKSISIFILYRLTKTNYRPIVIAGNHSSTKIATQTKPDGDANTRIKDPRFKCYETTARARRPGSALDGKLQRTKTLRPSEPQPTPGTLPSETREPLQRVTLFWSMWHILSNK